MQTASYKYVDENTISEDLKCVVCLDPFVEPVMHTQCRNVFCSVCLIESGQKCPVCREPVGPTYIASVPRIITNMLNDLKVLCPSCSIILARGELAAHLSKCGDAHMVITPAEPSAPPISDDEFPEPIKSHTPTTNNISDNSNNSNIRECPNRSNQFHTCTNYCRERYAPNSTYTPPPPQEVTFKHPSTPISITSTSSTSSSSSSSSSPSSSSSSPSSNEIDKDIATPKDRRNPRCPNISNPYHKCTQYCFDFHPVNYNLTKNPNNENNTTKKKTRSRYGNSRSNPYCPNTSNPFHQCSAYCFETYTSPSSPSAPASPSSPSSPSSPASPSSSTTSSSNSEYSPSNSSRHHKSSCKQQ